MTTTPPLPEREELKASMRRIVAGDAKLESALDQVGADALHQRLHQMVNKTEKDPPEDREQDIADQQVGYYQGWATHWRDDSRIPWRSGRNGTPQQGRLNAKFVGDVSLVRVPLPALPNTREEAAKDKSLGTIKTRLGEILGGDRLIYRLQELQGSDDRYRPKNLGFRPARADLVTAVRTGGVRFAGVSIYLVYETLTAKAPSYYMIEAGMAQGQPARLYVSADMATPIIDSSAYLPTPFVHQSNLYWGMLTMRSDKPDEPESLLVRSYAYGTLERWLQQRYDSQHELPALLDVHRAAGNPAPDCHYVEVKLDYSRIPVGASLPVNDPLAGIIEAAARVAVIAFESNDTGVIETDKIVYSILRMLASRYDWVIKPTFTADPKKTV